MAPIIIHNPVTDGVKEDTRGQTQQSSRSLELKVELQKPAGMPDLATTYCTQFQFNVDGSVTSIVFGQNGTWHAGVSIPTDMALELRNKLQKVMANIIRQPTAARAEEGLLQRQTAPKDARAYAVRLTEEGRRVLRTAEPLAEKVDDRILDALPGKRRSQFIGDLQTIVPILQRASSQDKG